MFFDAHAALEKLKSEQAPSATSATSATQPNIRADVADVAIVAAPPARKSETASEALDHSFQRSPSRGEPYQYGEAVGDRPKTWTGKVVSLDEWRRLSEWEKHGSTCKIWNGLTRQWEPVP